MILDVFHWTEYRYSEEVPLSQHTLHLAPRELPHQRVQAAHIEIKPSPAFVHERQDYFGNTVTEFMLDEAHRALHLKCHSRVETLPRRMDPETSTPSWEKVAAALMATSDPDPREFLYPSPYAPHLPGLRTWAEESFPADRPWLEGLRALTTRLHREFTFDRTATTVATPLARVFAGQRGVCQDFAHLEIAALRTLGLAARYVSGYLRTEPAEGEEHRFGADASHAWVAAYCPELGWVEIDPTNNRFVGEDYVTLGWGRDYGDVSLIRGVLGGGGSHTLHLSVNVEQVPGQNTAPSDAER